MALHRQNRELNSPAGAGATLRLRVLGHFEIVAPDGGSIEIPTKKNRGLLAILALSPSGRATREHLCGLLWGDRTEDQARSSLRQSLAVLRKELGEDETKVLQTRDDIVGLRLESLHVDAAEFLRLAECSDRESLRQAASLYRGELLQDTSIREAAFEDWLIASRRHVADRAIAAFEKLVRLETGQTAVEAAKRLCDLDPLREASHRSLIAAFIGAGERGLAIKQYELCRSILETELGVPPSDELKMLRQSLSAVAVEEGAKPKPDSLPAIAVLPFANMSDDRGSRYFSDGISEDIITELSRFGLCS
jgi:DNA-binding SARP family transcriptional activator